MNPMPIPAFYRHHAVIWQDWVNETAGNVWGWGTCAAAKQQFLTAYEVCGTGSDHEVTGTSRYIINTRDAGGTVRYWVWPVGECDEYPYPTFDEAMRAACDPDSHYGKRYLDE